MPQKTLLPVQHQVRVPRQALGKEPLGCDASNSTRLPVCPAESLAGIRLTCHPCPQLCVAGAGGSDPSPGDAAQPPTPFPYLPASVSSVK